MGPIQNYNQQKDRRTFPAWERALDPPPQCLNAACGQHRSLGFAWFPEANAFQALDLIFLASTCC